MAIKTIEYEELFKILWDLRVRETPKHANIRAMLTDSDGDVMSSTEVPISAVFVSRSDSVRIDEEIQDIILEAIKTRRVLTIMMFNDHQYSHDPMVLHYRVIHTGGCTPKTEMVLMVRDIDDEGIITERYRIVLMESEYSKGIAACYEAITTLAQEFARRD